MIFESPPLLILLNSYSKKVRTSDVLIPWQWKILKKILPNLSYCQDEYETTRNSDALVIATEWNQFRNLDLSKIKKFLKTPILLDLINLYDPAKAKALGFNYEGLGRK